MLLAFKAAGCTNGGRQWRRRATAVPALTARGHSLYSIKYTPQLDDSSGPCIAVRWYDFKNELLASRNEYDLGILSKYSEHGEA